MKKLAEEARQRAQRRHIDEILQRRAMPLEERIERLAEDAKRFREAAMRSRKAVRRNLSMLAAIVLMVGLAWYLARR